MCLYPTIDVQPTQTHYGKTTIHKQAYQLDTACHTLVRYYGFQHHHRCFSVGTTSAHLHRNTAGCISNPHGLASAANETRCFYPGRIEELGLETQQYEWYVDLRRHGAVKCSGFTFLFDPLVLYATGLNDVRDAVPFPRSLQASTTTAQSEVMAATRTFFIITESNLCIFFSTAPAYQKLSCRINSNKNTVPGFLRFAGYIRSITSGQSFSRKPCSFRPPPHTRTESIASIS